MKRSLLRCPHVNANAPIVVSSSPPPLLPLPLIHCCSPAVSGVLLLIVTLFTGGARGYYPNKEEGIYLNKELDHLVHDQNAPCEGPSKYWSCIRWVSEEEFANRDRMMKYGFRAEDEPEWGRPIGQEDGYESDYRMTQVPIFATGILKMSMPDDLYEVFKGWNKDAVELMSIHAEGSTLGLGNGHLRDTRKLDMLQFPIKYGKINDVLMKIFAAWAGRNDLVHTSTFGIRRYPDGFVLLNHVDMFPTHFVSAVLQVDQEGVKEGWPLEVVFNATHRAEVYLQPGEIVLYEGARLRHGRPMRFNGTSFSNVFVHGERFDLFCFVFI